MSKECWGLLKFYATISTPSFHKKSGLIPAHFSESLAGVLVKAPFAQITPCCWLKSVFLVYLYLFDPGGWENADLSTCAWFSSLLQLQQLSPTAWVFPPLPVTICTGGKLRDGRACWQLRRCPRPPDDREDFLGGSNFSVFFFCSPTICASFHHQKNRGLFVGPILLIWLTRVCQNLIEMVDKLKHTREQEYVVWTFLEY